MLNVFLFLFMASQTDIHKWVQPKKQLWFYLCVILISELVSVYLFFIHVFFVCLYQHIRNYSLSLYITINPVESKSAHIYL